MVPTNRFALRAATPYERVMLTGLLFATRDAVDRPGLAAALPFGGTTLIEAQARLLIVNGVTQIVVIAPTLTADLMGSLGRIGRRGQGVEIVRSLTDFSRKLHPLARVLMLADGLITTEATVAAVVRERHETLLVTPDTGLVSSMERVGGGLAWAGIASLDPKRLAEAAALPDDYDPQSTLLRLAVASGAAHLALSASALDAGHGIEFDAGTLRARGQRIVVAAIAQEPGWFNAVVIARIAKLIAPFVARQSAPGAIIMMGGLFVGACGLLCIATTWVKLGLVTAMTAIIALAIAAALARVQGETRQALFVKRTRDGVAALTALAVGLSAARAGQGLSGLVIASSLIVTAALAQQATQQPRRWWGCSSAYVLVMACCGLLGLPLIGLTIATGYAALTAAAGIAALQTRLASL